MKEKLMVKSSNFDMQTSFHRSLFVIYHERVISRRTIHVITIFFILISMHHRHWSKGQKTKQIEIESGLWGIFIDSLSLNFHSVSSFWFSFAFWNPIFFHFSLAFGALPRLKKQTTKYLNRSSEISSTAGHILCL